MTIRSTGLAIAALIAVSASGCETGEAADSATSLQTEQVTRGNLTIQAEATGTVEPIRIVEVKSKASGEILRLHTDIGDKVQPGALLAEVDPRDVRNAYDQTAADLEVAQARVEISQAQLRRSQQLLEAQVITEQEHESARLESANARANLVKAETNNELSQLRLSDVTIRAPLGGTIIQKNVEEGYVIQSASQNVSGGTTLFVMANLDQMQVRTLVDETDMGELLPGQTATVSVEAFPDRMFRGIVEKIEPQAVVEQNVTMFPVIVRLDNRGGLLKPGMNAEVNILINEAIDVVLVPNSAIVQLADVGPAAMALGMDVESMDLRSMMRGGRGGAGGGDGRPGGAAAADGAPAEGSAPAAGRPGAADRAAGARGQGGGAGGGRPGVAGGGARLDSLRARVQRGEISQDSMRVLAQAFRQGAGAARDGLGAPAADADEGGAPARESRPAAVFVINSQGQPEVRVIQVGLNDWDNTEVVSGLEEGDVLAVVGAAQLQAQQQEFLNNIRSRTGGSPFGGGGRPRGR